MSALAWPGAVDCGFARFRDSRDSRACLAGVIATNRPLRTGHFSAGDDSLYCDIAIRDGEGRLWSLWYDFDVTGAGTTGGGNAVLSVQRCRSIRLAPGTIGAGSYFDLEGCEPDAAARARLLRRIPWEERTSSGCTSGSESVRSEP